VGNSFPAWDPHARLDYLFVPAAFAAHARTCDVVSAELVLTASDHFPISAELDV
jgi:endonuclease/exonuclease/phosphatase family metal-dependent hydrolase